VLHYVELYVIFSTWKMLFSQKQQLAMNAVPYLIVTISIKMFFFLSCNNDVSFISSLNCLLDAPKKIIEEG